MTRTIPIPVATEDLSQHPVMRAWSSLHTRVPEGVVRLREASRTKPALFRLTFELSGRPAVFAKLLRPEDPPGERRVFERVLPDLPVPTPRFHGVCDQPDGSAWLFVEDVGEHCYAPHDPEQRRIAARWLGRMHGTAAALAGRTELPDAGPARYLARLRSGRAQILEHRRNPALSPADHEVLNAVLEREDRLESRWPDLESFCARFPVTLVHADFQPKNLRFLEEDGETILRPIDWETAGWGVPAADLAFASSRRPAFSVDPEAYEHTVREYLPGLDGNAIHRLAVVGRLFQAMAGIDWACADLRFRGARYLLRPISSMRVYLVQVDTALADAEAWLR